MIMAGQRTRKAFPPSAATKNVQEERKLFGAVCVSSLSLDLQNEPQRSVGKVVGFIFVPTALDYID